MWNVSFRAAAAEEGDLERHFLFAEEGESLAIIGNSGSGKTTLGKMLVGSILPTSGNVRLDLMDLRNWDQRQFGESIGYLPGTCSCFPAPSRPISVACVTMSKTGRSTRRLCSPTYTS